MNCTYGKYSGTGTYAQVVVGTRVVACICKLLDYKCSGAL